MAVAGVARLRPRARRACALRSGRNGLLQGRHGGLDGRRGQQLRRRDAFLIGGRLQLWLRVVGGALADGWSLAWERWGGRVLELLQEDVALLLPPAERLLERAERLWLLLLLLLLLIAATAVLPRCAAQARLGAPLPIPRCNARKSTHAYAVSCMQRRAAGCSCVRDAVVCARMSHDGARGKHGHDSPIISTELST